MPNDLGLRLSRGDPAGAPPAMEIERELTIADIAELGAAQLGAKTPPIAELRHRHHLLARFLAEGRSGVECSVLTGYSQSRISLLQDDPAFAELVSYYKAQTEAVYLDVHARMSALGVAAIEELQERLDTKPETFGNKELRELMAETMERTDAPSKGPGRGGGGGQAEPPTLVIRFVEPGSESAHAPATSLTITSGQPAKVIDNGGSDQ